MMTHVDKVLREFKIKFKGEVDGDVGFRMESFLRKALEDQESRHKQEDAKNNKFFFDKGVESEHWRLTKTQSLGDE